MCILYKRLTKLTDSMLVILNDTFSNKNTYDDAVLKVDNQIERELHRLISLYMYQTSHTNNRPKCDFALKLYF